MKQEKPKVAGLDGCPAGWLLFYGYNNEFDFQLISSIKEAIPIFEQCRYIFIDIPIGLSSKAYQRQVEGQMRKLLQGRSSTIFTPPCREAIECKDYAVANEVNRQITGKGLSVQAFNISKKIAEVDTFLRSKRDFSLQESHPEISSKILKGNVLQTKKNTMAGQQERRDIIRSISPDLDLSVEKALGQYPKKMVRSDDIIDAAMLCLSAQTGMVYHTLVWKDTHYFDHEGIEVSIAAGEIQ